MNEIETEPINLFKEAFLHIYNNDTDTSSVVTYYDLTNISYEIKVFSLDFCIIAIYLSWLLCKYEIKDVF